MMNTPLLLRHLFEYAQTYYPKKRIISRTREGLFRYTYAEFGDRTRRLSAALTQLGVQPGDKVGTFAWNDHRHLEAYFAIPCMGAVLHTINIRLSPDQIAYIVNHAEDKVLFVDAGLLPLLEPIRDQLSSVHAFVLLGDAVDVSASPLQPAYSYEALLADTDHDFVYPTDLDENTPMGMCYTSATTGNPKGVTYSHRGIYLHSMALGLANTAGLSERHRSPNCPYVPRQRLGLAVRRRVVRRQHGAARTSADASHSTRPHDGGRSDFCRGCPHSLAGHTQGTGGTPAQSIAAHGIVWWISAPPALIRAYEEQHGIPFVHAYGMTETSPLATFSRLKSYQQERPEDERLAIRATQGLLVPGLEMRLHNGHEDVPWDGQHMGELLLRAPGLRITTTTTSARRTRLSTAGCTRVTWPPWTAKGSSAWWIGPKTWSRAVASGFPP